MTLLGVRLRPKPPQRRVRARLRLALGALAWLLTACAAAPRPGVPPAGADWSAYRGLLVPQPLIPIEATGSVLFDYRGERQSGNVLVRGNRRRDFVLQVTSPVLGTAALEVRLTERELLVMDFGSESYFLGENSAPNRLKLFSLDMTPEEFLIVLTARVPASLFEAGNGTLEPAGSAEFRSGGALYRFDLDPAGLPLNWSKEGGGATQWRVEYREYQEVPVGAGPAGGVLRLPRKVRVYAYGSGASGAGKAGERAPRLVLGIASFRLWSEDPAVARVSLEPPPGMRFQPLEEQLPAEAR